MSARSGTCSARRRIEERILASDAMRELAGELTAYPVRLLQQLVAEYTRRGAAVPDHVLDIVPYLGDTALRALVDAGLADRIDDSPHAIRAYVPTAEAIELNASLAIEP
jgi:hypothetical protein